jgi:hypothetical protein
MLETIKLLVPIPGVMTVPAGNIVLGAVDGISTLCRAVVFNGPVIRPPVSDVVSRVTKTGRAGLVDIIGGLTGAKPGFPIPIRTPRWAMAGATTLINEMQEMINGVVRLR